MTQNLKPNFWQILGIVLVLIGLAFLIRRNTGVTPATPIEPVAPPSQVLPGPTQAVPTH